MSHAFASAVTCPAAHCHPTREQAKGALDTTLHGLMMHAEQTAKDGSSR
jgi:hypothetical protein